MSSPPPFCFSGPISPPGFCPLQAGRQVLAISQLDCRNHLPSSPNPHKPFCRPLQEGSSNTRRSLCWRLQKLLGAALPRVSATAQNALLTGPPSPFPRYHHTRSHPPADCVLQPSSSPRLRSLLPPSLVLAVSQTRSCLHRVSPRPQSLC